MGARARSPRRIVIAGGGVAALEAMLALRRLAGERLRIALVTPGRELVHRPLPVAEPFGPDRTHRFDLGTLAASAGAELVCSKLVAIEPDEHRIVTDDGAELGYDALVVATEARPRPALAGAITFWEVADRAEIMRMIAELETGAIERVAFAAHAGCAWSLPLYELALLTGAQLRRAGIGAGGLVLVTGERRPLAMFGREASGGVRALLEDGGIGLITSRDPAAFRNGSLETHPEGSVAVDRVVALPLLEGPRLAGLPADEGGFVPVDSLCRVLGAADVYAAGDITAFSVKQSGIAAEQAYTAATAIAAAAGAPVEPEPFRPVLRGLLLSGGGAEGAGRCPEALWWPPGMIAGRFLGPHLAKIAGRSLDQGKPSAAARIPVEIELSGTPARV